MRAKWDELSKKYFEGGCSHAMCYNLNHTTNKYDYGEAWSGVTSFTNNPSGAEEQASYADNIKYISIRGAENYGFSIGCFFYPDNFKKCLGKKTIANGVTVSQQERENFGFCVTTQVGNDVSGLDYGETIHLVWNATASPVSKDYSTMNESPAPTEISVECTANPINAGRDLKPTCKMDICTVGMDSETYQIVRELKDILYGTESTNPRLPDPEEVVAMFQNANGNYVYWGVAPDFSTITSLSQERSATPARTITVNAGPGEYIIYAYPSRLGRVEFWVGIFEGGFEEPITRNITNYQGETEEYYIYRSTHANLGETTIEIKEA
jgi:hypothetical protein